MPGKVRGLLFWCKKVTKGYEGVSVTDMSSSWRDGLAFCALIHRFRPDLIDFDSLSAANVYQNNKLAFSIAEQEFDIPSLLDPEDLARMVSPDRYSVVTYVSQFYDVFKDKPFVSTKGCEEEEQEDSNGLSRGDSVAGESADRQVDISSVHGKEKLEISEDQKELKDVGNGTIGASFDKKVKDDLVENLPTNESQLSSEADDKDYVFDKKNTSQLNTGGTLDVQHSDTHIPALGFEIKESQGKSEAREMSNLKELTESRCDLEGEAKQVQKIHCTVENYPVETGDIPESCVDNQMPAVKAIEESKEIALTTNSDGSDGENALRVDTGSTGAAVEGEITLDAICNSDDGEVGQEIIADGAFEPDITVDVQDSKANIPENDSIPELNIPNGVDIPGSDRVLVDNTSNMETVDVSNVTELISGGQDSTIPVQICEDINTDCIQEKMEPCPDQFHETAIEDLDRIPEKEFDSTDISKCSELNTEISCEDTVNDTEEIVTVRMSTAVSESVLEREARVAEALPETVVGNTDTAPDETPTDTDGTQDSTCASSDGTEEKSSSSNIEERFDDEAKLVSEEVTMETEISRDVSLSEDCIQVTGILKSTEVDVDASEKSVTEETTMETNLSVNSTKSNIANATELKTDALSEGEGYSVDGEAMQLGFDTVAEDDEKAKGLDAPDGDENSSVSYTGMSISVPDGVETGVSTEIALDEESMSSPVTASESYGTVKEGSLSDGGEMDSEVQGREPDTLIELTADVTSTGTLVDIETVQEIDVTSTLTMEEKDTVELKNNIDTDNSVPAKTDLDVPFDTNSSESTEILIAQLNGTASIDTVSTDFQDSRPNQTNITTRENIEDIVVKVDTASEDSKAITAEQILCQNAEDKIALDVDTVSKDSETIAHQQYPLQDTEVEIALDVETTRAEVTMNVDTNPEDSESNLKDISQVQDTTGTKAALVVDTGCTEITLNDDTVGENVDVTVTKTTTIETALSSETALKTDAVCTEIALEGDTTSTFADVIIMETAIKETALEVNDVSLEIAQKVDIASTEIALMNGTAGTEAINPSTGVISCYQVQTDPVTLETNDAECTVEKKEEEIETVKSEGTDKESDSSENKTEVDPKGEVLSNIALRTDEQRGKPAEINGHSPEDTLQGEKQELQKFGEIKEISHEMTNNKTVGKTDNKPEILSESNATEQNLVLNVHSPDDPPALPDSEPPALPLVAPPALPDSVTDTGTHSEETVLLEISPAVENMIPAHISSEQKHSVDKGDFIMTQDKTESYQKNDETEIKISGKVSKYLLQEIQATAMLPSLVSSDDEQEIDDETIKTTENEEILIPAIVPVVQAEPAVKSERLLNVDEKHKSLQDSTETIVKQDNAENTDINERIEADNYNRKTETEEFKGKIEEGDKVVSQISETDILAPADAPVLLSPRVDTAVAETEIYDLNKDSDMQSLAGAVERHIDSIPQAYDSQLEEHLLDSHAPLVSTEPDPTSDAKFEQCAEIKTLPEIRTARKFEGQTGSSPSLDKEHSLEEAVGSLVTDSEIKGVVDENRIGENLTAPMNVESGPSAEVDTDILKKAALMSLKMAKKRKEQRIGKDSVPELTNEKNLSVVKPVSPKDKTDKEGSQINTKHEVSREEQKKVDISPPIKDEGSPGRTDRSKVTETLRKVQYWTRPTKVKLESFERDSKEEEAAPASEFKKKMLMWNRKSVGSPPSELIYHKPGHERQNSTDDSADTKGTHSPEMASFHVAPTRAETQGSSQSKDTPLISSASFSEPKVSPAVPLRRKGVAPGPKTRCVSSIELGNANANQWTKKSAEVSASDIFASRPRRLFRNSEEFKLAVRPLSEKPTLTDDGQDLELPPTRPPRLKKLLRQQGGSEDAKVNLSIRPISMQYDFHDDTEPVNLASGRAQSKPLRACSFGGRPSSTSTPLKVDVPQISSGGNSPSAVSPISPKPAVTLRRYSSERLKIPVRPISQQLLSSEKEEEFHSSSKGDTSARRSLSFSSSSSSQSKSPVSPRLNISVQPVTVKIQQDKAKARAIIQEELRKKSLEHEIPRIVVESGTGMAKEEAVIFTNVEAVSSTPPLIKSQKQEEIVESLTKQIDTESNSKEEKQIRPTESSSIPVKELTRPKVTLRKTLSDARQFETAAQMRRPPSRPVRKSNSIYGTIKLFQEKITNSHQDSSPARGLLMKARSLSNEDSSSIDSCDNSETIPSPNKSTPQEIDRPELKEGLKNIIQDLEVEMDDDIADSNGSGKTSQPESKAEVPDSYVKATDKNGLPDSAHSKSRQSLIIASGPLETENTSVVDKKRPERDTKKITSSRIDSKDYGKKAEKPHIYSLIKSNMKSLQDSKKVDQKNEEADLVQPQIKAQQEVIPEVEVQEEVIVKETKKVVECLPRLVHQPHSKRTDTEMDEDTRLKMMEKIESQIIQLEFGKNWEECGEKPVKLELCESEEDQKTTKTPKVEVLEIVTEYITLQSAAQKMAVNGSCGCVALANPEEEFIFRTPVEEELLVPEHHHREICYTWPKTPQLDWAEEECSETDDSEAGKTLDYEFDTMRVKNGDKSESSSSDSESSLSESEDDGHYDDVDESKQNEAWVSKVRKDDSSVIENSSDNSSDDGQIDDSDRIHAETYKASESSDIESAEKDIKVDGDDDDVDDDDDERNERGTNEVRKSDSSDSESSSENSKDAGHNDGGDDGEENDLEMHEVRKSDSSEEESLNNDEEFSFSSNSKESLEEDNKILNSTTGEAREGNDLDVGKHGHGAFNWENNSLDQHDREHKKIEEIQIQMVKRTDDENSGSQDKLETDEREAECLDCHTGRTVIRSFYFGNSEEKLPDEVVYSQDDDDDDVSDSNSGSEENDYKRNSDEDELVISNLKESDTRDIKHSCSSSDSISEGSDSVIGRKQTWAPTAENENENKVFSDSEDEADSEDEDENKTDRTVIKIQISEGSLSMPDNEANKMSLIPDHENGGPAELENEDEFEQRVETFENTTISVENVEVVPFVLESKYWKGDLTVENDTKQHQLDCVFENILENDQILVVHKGSEVPVCAIGNPGGNFEYETALEPENEMKEDIPVIVSVFEIENTFENDSVEQDIEGEVNMNDVSDENAENYTDSEKEHETEENVKISEIENDTICPEDREVEKFAPIGVENVNEDKTSQHRGSMEDIYMYVEPENITENSFENEYITLNQVKKVTIKDIQVEDGTSRDGVSIQTPDDEQERVENTSENESKSFGTECEPEVFDYESDSSKSSSGKSDSSSQHSARDVAVTEELVGLDKNNTKFLIGREKDPSKSEVARLIQQSLEQDRRREELRKLEQEKLQEFHDHFKPLDEVLVQEHHRHHSESSTSRGEEENVDLDESSENDDAAEEEMSEELMAGEATPLSMPSGVDTDNSVSSPEDGSKPSIEVFDLQESGSESVSPDMESQALFVKLKEAQCKYAVSEAEIAKLKAKIIVLENTEAQKKQYEKKCEEMALRLRDMEKSLGNARKEINHYQDMMEGSQGQYIALEKKMKGEVTALEKKYHKAKKLIKEYQQREKDFIAERESLLQQQTEKDQQYNALVKSLKDRIFQLEGDLGEAQQAAGLPVLMPPQETVQKVENVVTKSAPPVKVLSPSESVSPVASPAGVETESVSSESDLSSMEPVTSPDFDDSSKEMKSETFESIPQTELLDISISKTKGQLASAGGNASRRPPTKRSKSQEGELDLVTDGQDPQQHQSESGLETWIKHDSDSTVKKSDAKRRKAQLHGTETPPPVPKSLPPTPPPLPSQPPPPLTDNESVSDSASRERHETESEESSSTVSQTSYNPSNPNWLSKDSEIPGFDTVSVDTAGTAETAESSSSTGAASTGSLPKKSKGISFPKILKFGSSGDRDKGGIVLVSNRPLNTDDNQSTTSASSEGGVMLLSKKNLNSGFDYDGASTNSEISSSYMVGEFSDEGKSSKYNFSGTPASGDNPSLQGRHNQNQIQSGSIAQWNNEHVCHWLMGIEMERYCPLFTEKSISGSQLVMMDGNKLKTLGISSSKDREVLKKKIKELKAAMDRERKQQERERKLQEKEQKAKEKEQKKQQKKK